MNLTTDNPSVIHVPANVTIAAGNSTNTFTIGTSPVSGLSTGGNVFASAGGVTSINFRQRSSGSKCTAFTAIHDN